MEYPWSVVNSAQVNNRLKPIMDNSLDFGGAHIISVGDFHQLRPVNQ